MFFLFPDSPVPDARRRLRALLWPCLLLLSATLGFRGLRLIRRQRAVEAGAREVCRSRTVAAARKIQALLEAKESLVHGLATDLEQGRLPVRDLPERLEAVLAGAPPTVARVGVHFRPAAAEPEGRLRNPGAERGPGGIRRIDFGEPAGPGAAGNRPGRAAWGEPRRDPASGDLRVDCREFLRLPGSAEVSGAVRLEVSLEDIQAQVADLAPGSTGHGFLLSARGTFLADPLQARVRNRETLEGVAKATGNPGLRRIARSAAAGRADFVETGTAGAGGRTWIFVEPVRAGGWALGTVILKDELVLASPGLRRELPLLITLAVLAGFTGLVLLLGLPTRDARRLWAFSGGASLLLAAGTGLLWSFAYTLPQDHPGGEVEVMNRARLDAFLAEYARLGNGLRESETVFIPAGVFIQQMELAGDATMKVSGQVWERFPGDFPPEGEGVVFPEAVSCDIGPALARDEGTARIRVYPFRGVFRLRSGSIASYPFDQTSVRLRIWPKLFHSSVVLVPDLEAYTLRMPTSLPGLDRNLSLPGWRLGRSGFSFLPLAYNTNFGLKDFSGQQDSPELVFTCTLRRNFTNPFIATFLPILVVAGLLFSLVLTSTPVPARAHESGYSVMNMLRGASSLFFPVVLAQINLHTRIPTDGLLYVEYYYFAVYAMILLVTVNALALFLGKCAWLGREDNRIAKVAFWPLLCVAFFAISVRYLV